MNRASTMLLAGLASVSVASILPAPASAGELVANPETIFEHGMKWSFKNGDHGVLHLNSNGSAVTSWNEKTYWGHWEKVDEYHVKTTWESGGPPGAVWSLRATGDPAVPYVASRRAM